MKKLLIILLSLTIFSCSKEEVVKEEMSTVSGDQVSLTNLQIKNSGIETNTLNNLDIAHKIMLTGQIDVPPQGMASVSAPSGGYIRVSRFMPGNYVKKGQTLATLENPELVQLQQDYLLANSENGFTELLNFKEENKSKKFVTKGAYQLLMAVKNMGE
ncbi:efflux RND transporter periplasmic adaptor subunit [Chryseobacterium sp. SNU WT5]|uniref:efflux RND transporter periplasmic adaptor subunit n=1 Tax=Chryseobacterium sp. SNU WT5 TaxID=2594269 RepID=UPI0016239202|nr:efflux RND transporter periplasmic adaptor subunit [Chryseobacterium sp. SNU WT5]